MSDLVPLDFQAAYDELNPADHDYRYYSALAEELGAERVLDLGCGTGTLALMLARNGHRVVAIDPDAQMLRVARERRDSAGVDWRLGFVDAADNGASDLAVMSGHVAQVFVDDAEWGSTLAHLHRALSHGGTLAFEVRNPSARAWEAWTRERTLRTVDTEAGTVEFWHQTADVDLPRVTYDTLTRDLATGAESRDREVLAFRDIDALRTSLESAGFGGISACGDWDGRPLSDESSEIVLTAVRD